MAKVKDLDAAQTLTQAQGAVSAAGHADVDLGNVDAETGRLALEVYSKDEIDSKTYKNTITTTNPTGADNEAAGYTPGFSRWHNTSTNESMLFLGDQPAGTGVWTEGPSFSISDLNGALSTTHFIASVVTSLGLADTSLQPRDVVEHDSTTDGGTLAANDLTKRLYLITMNGTESVTVNLGDVSLYKEAITICRLGTGTGTITLDAGSGKTILLTQTDTSLTNSGESKILTPATATMWILK